MSTPVNLQNYVKEEYRESAESICAFKLAHGNKMPFFHWHSHYEIILVLRGNYKITNGSFVAEGTKPLAIVHCPYTLHQGIASEDAIYERYVITFNKKIIRSFSPETMDISPLLGASLIYAEPNPAEIASLTDHAQKLQEYRDDPTMRALFIAVILRRIMMICEAGRGEIIRSGSSYIQEALQYIPEHLSEPETAAEIAARFGVCPAKFHRDFRATVGKTYKQHLTDLRQTFARELLTSGASIINASIDTGYSSEAHFIKAFREYWGITPGEYIRQNSDSG